MSTRFPPPKSPPPPPPKKASEPDNGNALWRVAAWFPNLDPKLLESLKIFQNELLRFNAKVNLISRSTERDSDEVHFADCILAIELLKKAGLGKRIFDIGSGNGFPGLIYALMDPSREFMLVESDSRKCEFLKYMINLLVLKNTTVMSVRIESLQAAGVEDAISRGFAPISKALLACNKVFPSGGRFFHLKGTNWSTEIAGLPSQLISVWKPHLLGEYSLPVSQARRAVVITQKN